MRSLFLLLALLAGSVFARADNATFIVNPSVTATALSTEEVKSILLGNKTKWDNGNLTLVVQTSGALHDAVIQTYAQRSSEQFDRFWKKQVFTGKGSAPATGKTDAEVVALVASTAGAIGYVAPSAVTDKVKALPVQ